jgi:hypothetical protein
MVARDVRQARADLNFSNWSTDTLREPTPTQRLGGICSDLRKGIMPLRSYLLMHREARLSAADVDRVCDWTEVAKTHLDVGQASRSTVIRAGWLVDPATGQALRDQSIVVEGGLTP